MQKNTEEVLLEIRGKLSEISSSKSERPILGTILRRVCELWIGGALRG